MIPNSRFQIRNLPFFRLFTSRSRLTAHDSRLTARRSPLSAHGSRLTARRSLLTALLLTALSSPLFASTPGFDTLVNYDTAWTYVYDGGKYKDGVTAIQDIFYDVKCLSNGMTLCVGASGDTSAAHLLILMKIDANGKIAQKKLYSTSKLQRTQYNNQSAHSLFIAKNGDFIIGGGRFGNPWVMRTDTLGNIKWSKWYYDSVAGKSILQIGTTVNSLRETSRGTIICATGDIFPDNNGLGLTNYAAMIEFDSLGRSPYDTTQPCYINNQFYLDAGYDIDGFYIDETKGKNFVLSGYQSVYYTDSLGNPIWKSNYTFSLNGVGTVKNNISRAKVLRDNTLIAAGQAYEGNCWTKYKTLYYDAWWSPVNYGSGLNTNWDTAGRQGRTDYLYDFTQLNNGNLVFVGTKANTSSDSGGIWTFVTDSIGKQLYYEKQTKVPYKTTNGFGVIPFSVCATPDGGFTVAGVDECVDSLGGENAFAAHFIPKPISAVMYRGNFQAKSINSINVHVSGEKLIVSGNAATKNIDEVSLFDITGKRLPLSRGTTLRSGRRTRGVAEGRGEVASIQFDISHLSKGTYVVRVKAGSAVQTMKFIRER